MDEIKNLVHKVIEKISSQKPTTQVKIQDDWYKIAGEAARQHTKLGGIKEGMLIVYVDSPAWMFEMNLKRAPLLRQLQSEHAEIRKLIFKIGKI